MSLPAPRPDAGVPHAQAARRWLVGASVLLVAGVLLARTPSDVAWFAAVNGLGPALAPTASTLSVLGLGATALVAAAIAGLRWPRVAAAVLLLVLCGGVAVQLIKAGLATPRPLAVLGPQGVAVTGMALTARSMPSGHAALLAALATLAWLWPAASHRRRLGLGTVLTLLALAGAAARIAVGAHWPSDLLVGLAVGAGLAALTVGTARGWRLVDAVADWLCTRTGTCAMVALLAATSATLWVALPEQPAAGGLQDLIAAAGVLAALAWWRRHPGALSLRAWSAPRPTGPAR
jgi:membrane-associated phospholipid phosphatase